MALPSGGSFESATLSFVNEDVRAVQAVLLLLVDASQYADKS